MVMLNEIDSQLKCCLGWVKRNLTKTFYPEVVISRYLNQSYNEKRYKSKVSIGFK
jgi:hypothetical protein